MKYVVMGIAILVVMFIIHKSKNKHQLNLTRLEKLILGDNRSNNIGLILNCTFFLFFVYIVILIDIKSIFYLILFISIVAFFSENVEKEVKQFVKDLDTDLKIQIEKELESPMIYCNYNYALTPNYVVKGSKPFAILKYSDIILMYKKVHYNLGKYRSGGIDEYLILITKENKKYEFLISTTILAVNYDPKDFSYIIKEKNPEVLEGETKENIEILKNKYNIEF